ELPQAVRQLHAAGATEPNIGPGNRLAIRILDDSLRGRCASRPDTSKRADHARSIPAQDPRLWLTSHDGGESGWGDDHPQVRTRQKERERQIRGYLFELDGDAGVLGDEAV